LLHKHSYFHFFNLILNGSKWRLSCNQLVRFNIARFSACSVITQ